MTKRQVVIDALNFRRPKYVPWEWGPTIRCAEHLRRSDPGCKFNTAEWSSISPLSLDGRGQG